MIPEHLATSCELGSPSRRSARTLVLYVQDGDSVKQGGTFDGEGVAVATGTRHAGLEGRFAIQRIAHLLPFTPSLCQRGRDAP